MGKSWSETEDYVPPSEQGIKNAVAHGVKNKWAKLGYDICEGSCGTFVRRLYFAYETEKKNLPSNEACAKHAESLKLCKIIPVKKLPEYMPRFLRKYIWVDTPENREKIRTYFSYLEST